ncbi:MAG: YgjV family protein [Ruminococcaceae bacterium]|nr:YgjV family protein [Oscillospiraceae bacterium]
MPAFFENADPIYLIAQIIGVFAAFFGIFSFQQKSRSGILIWQIINNVLWTVHMFLLGAFAGGMLNAIGIFRGIVFYFRKDQGWAQSNVWYAVFCALFAAASVFSWIQGEGALALLPMAGMFFTTFSLAQKDPFRVRLLSFFSSPCWLTYNIIKGSIPGAATETFLICSIVIGILRHDLPRRRKV